jgi:hypothetical protein
MRDAHRRGLQPPHAREVREGRACMAEYMLRRAAAGRRWSQLAIRLRRRTGNSLVVGQPSRRSQRRNTVTAPRSIRVLVVAALSAFGVMSCSSAHRTYHAGWQLTKVRDNGRVIDLEWRRVFCLDHLEHIQVKESALAVTVTVVAKRGPRTGCRETSIPAPVHLSDPIGSRTLEGCGHEDCRAIKRRSQA